MIWITCSVLMTAYLSMMSRCSSQPCIYTMDSVSRASQVAQNTPRKIRHHSGQMFRPSRVGYFGLSREMFGDSLQVEDFVRPAPPDHPQTVSYQCLLTTAKLQDYFEHSHKFNRSIVAIYVPTKLTNRLGDLLTFVMDQCNRFDHAQAGYDEEVPAVLPTVRILIQTFDRYNKDYCYVPFRSHIPNTVYGHSYLSTKPIQQHMLRKRSVWCPHQVQYLIRTFSYHALIYVAEIKRCVAEWVDRSRCSEESRCISYNIDNKDFHGRHAGKCSYPRSLRSSLGVQEFLI